MPRKAVTEISGTLGRATLSWGLLAPRRKRNFLSTAELVFCEGERHVSIVITHIVITHPA
jgi:hypothetical protein